VRIRATRTIGENVLLRQTDANGVADGEFAVDSTVDRVTIRGEFAGDQTHSAVSVQQEFALDREFVQVALSMPHVIDLEGDAPAAVVTVDFSNVVRRAAQGLSVALLLDDQSIATSVTDATGRAALSVSVDQLQVVGVHRFRARVEAGGAEKFSPERRVVVRGLTSVVARLDGAHPESRWIFVRGAVAWRGGGVANATVALMHNNDRLAIGEADERGAFSLQVHTDALAPGTRARVVYVSSRPWFSGSESDELLLLPPSPRRISWRVVVLPFALVMFAVAMARLRNSRRIAATETTAIDDATSISYSQTTDSVASVRVEVYDRSTGNLLTNCSVTINGVQASNATVELHQDKNSVRVACAGYAPRAIELARVRGRSSVLRVGLSNWREFAFGLLRPLLPKRGKNAVLSTVAEAADARSASENDLLRRGEGVVYGPDTPSQADVIALTSSPADDRESER
jgi:hypothetical protein